jgi:hypothetical protein
LAPEQGAEVDEYVEIQIFEGNERGIIERNVRGMNVAVSHFARERGAVGVVAHHQPPELCQISLRARRGRIQVGHDSREIQSLPARRLALRATRLDEQHRRADAELHVVHHHHLAHLAGELGSDDHLHLHRLEDDETVSHVDFLAFAHEHLDHDRRRGCADETAAVARDSMRHAVDLDEHTEALVDGLNSKVVVSNAEPPLRPPKAFDQDFNALPVDIDAIALRAQAEHA